MIYENEETLATERKGITVVADKWMAEVVKLPRRYSADFAMLRQKQVKAWVEFKSRTNPFKKYPTYMVALYKYSRLLALARDTGIPAFIVVQWTDCTGYVQVPTAVEIEFSGRKDRGDWEDMEPVVTIPLSLFTIITELDDGKGLQSS